MTPGQSIRDGLWLYAHPVRICNYRYNLPRILSVSPAAAVHLMSIENWRTEGIILLASCICDIGLEAVEWTREWIASLDWIRRHSR